MTLLENLQHKLGLTQNEAKVYSSLIQGSPIDVAGLTTSTDLPRSRIYEVLSSLAAKNLLDKQGSGTYRLIPPKQSITTIRSQIDKEYRARSAEIEELGDYLQNVWQKEISDLAPGVEILTIEEAEPLFINHLKEVKNRVWIAAADTHASINMRQSGTALGQNPKPGLDVRYMMSDKQVAIRVAKAFSYFTPFNQLDYKIRHHPDLYTSFVILDQVIYIFFFGNEDTLRASSLRTSSNQLLLSFEWMFNQLWTAATEVNPNGDNVEN